MRPLDWQLDAANYAFAHEVTPQIGHLDTIRHVNNVAVQGFHLEARTRFHMALFGGDAWFSDDVLLRPRRTVTHFVAETHYPDPVACALRVVAAAADCYRLVQALFQNGRCTGVQECLMGAWQGDRWVALPRAVAEAMAARAEADRPLADWPVLEADNAAVGAYPSRTDLVARYADLDPDRCLGELALGRYAEQARAASLGMIRGAGGALLVARVDLRHARWDTGLGGIELASGLATIGNTSFAVRSGVRVNATLAAVSESVMVLMDRRRERPIAIDAALRTAMSDILIEREEQPTEAAIHRE